MSSEREVMTWDDLGAGARELAERIHADAYEPDVILAIARGGLLLAGALGYALGVKNTYTMNVEFYTGIDERLPVPMILPPVPDLILSIARGGLGLGMGLGYALDVKNLSAVNVEFYTGVDQRLDVPIMLPPTPAAVDLAGLKILIADDVADTGKTLEVVRDFVDLHDARILIADDVADTGHTLRSVQQFCEGKVAEVRTAVLYEKSHSVVKCDYVWKRTDLWINFPWSDKPPVAKREWAVKDA